MMMDQQQAQQVCITCPADRSTLFQLLDDVQHTLLAAQAQATILLYGRSPKTTNGFIIVEATCGMPTSFLTWLKADERIIDYTIYDVPSCGQASLTARAAAWYAPHLPAPDIPVGFCLLADPISLDRPSDEIWMALAQSENYDFAPGILVYGDGRMLWFFMGEEAINALSYLLEHARPLLDTCSPEFFVAPQHAERLAHIRRALAAMPERSEGGSQQ